LPLVLINVKQHVNYQDNDEANNEELEPKGWRINKIYYTEKREDENDRPDDNISLVPGLFGYLF
jgi:hypothetical protein